MISTPELLEKLRSDLENIKNEYDAEKLRERIDKFIDKYDVWPDLQSVKQQIAAQKKEDQEKLLSLEPKAEQEIEQTFLRITTECTDQKIIIPRELLLPYDQKALISGERLKSELWFSLKEACKQKGTPVPSELSPEYKEYLDQGIECIEYRYSTLLTARFFAVKHMLEFLFDQGHKELVRPFVIIHERDYIEWHVFSETYLKWDQLRQEHKTSIWYHFDQLAVYANEGKPGGKRKQLTTDECYQYYQNIVLSFGQPVDKYALKQCASHVYEYTKEMLLKTEQSSQKKNQPATKSQRKLTLKKDKETGDVVFTYGSKRLNFGKKTQRARLSWVIFHAQKQTSYSEIYDLLGQERIDDDPSGIEQHVVENAIKDINKEFKSKLKLSNVIKTKNRKQIFVNAKHTVDNRL